jgi:hypothetical protein
MASPGRAFEQERCGIPRRPLRDQNSFWHVRICEESIPEGDVLLGKPELLGYEGEGYQEGQLTECQARTPLPCGTGVIKE